MPDGDKITRLAGLLGEKYDVPTVLDYIRSIKSSHGGELAPSVVTAPLPKKFNGSQARARTYSEGYLKGAKPVTRGLNESGKKSFDAVDTVAGFVPGSVGTVDWLGHLGADIANGNYGSAAKDAVFAAGMGFLGNGIGRVASKYAGRLPYLRKAVDFPDDLSWNSGRASAAGIRIRGDCGKSPLN